MSIIPSFIWKISVTNILTKIDEVLFNPTSD